MRICFLSSDYTPDRPAGAGGGIETYVRCISRGLADRGHDVHVVLPTQGATRSLFDGRVRVHAIRIPHDWDSADSQPLLEARSALSFAWHVRRKVRALIDECGPFDVVEAPEYKAQGLFLAQDGDIPLVVKCHAHLLFCLETSGIALTPDTALVADLEREALSRARAVHANSRFLAARVSDDYGLDDARIAHVPYGIDTDLFQPTHSQLRAHLGVGERPLILFAGRMEERKGMSVLVRAFAELAERRPEVVLLLAGADVSGGGHDSNAAWMCAEWERLGVPSHRFLFLGNVPHARMPMIYSAADLMVAPSPFEAFGFVYVEAMACGCPPVGCTTGGAPEVIADGDGGVLVEPANPSALASCLSTLVDDRTRRSQLSARGRARVRRDFTLGAMVTRTETFYRSIVTREVAA
jgi:glycosyltransferase involved in cell wall biosynthesis